MFTYDLFKKMTARVISVSQLTESKNRFEHTYNQLKRLGIQDIKKEEAVFVEDTDTINELAHKYSLDKTLFRGFDTWFACTLTSLRLWDNLLKNTDEEYFLICENDITCIQECVFYINYYFDKLDDNWDVLHLGSTCPLDAYLCLANEDIIYTQKLLQKNIKLPNDPMNGIIGGWCSIYTRNALEVFIKNSNVLFKNTADAGIFDSFKRYNIRIACVNKRIEEFEFGYTSFKPTLIDRVSIGLVFQDAKFNSLNLKYRKSKHYLKNIHT